MNEIDTNDKKRIALIVSYYLSRCDLEAVHSLGYSGFTEAFKDLGDILNENPNNIKNMRDEFDPHFPNDRKGWYQRPLSPSRQEVFEQFSQYSDIELDLYVKKILSRMKGKEQMNNEIVLRDLSALIRQSTVHYNQGFVWQDVELTNEFKSAYEEYLDKHEYTIEFFDATSVITTSTKRNIFVPNQWFVMASYAVGVYTELATYKAYFEKMADLCGQKRDAYAKALRDDTSTVDKTLFINTGTNMFQLEVVSEENARKAANRLWRFATDYSWWSGSKTIDRGDFYLSVVLNMLNLVNVSQGYVGDIVNAYGSDTRLLELTRSLESFTKNMEGVTYDFVIREEQDKGDVLLPLEIVKTPVKHKISISSESISKLGGK